MESLQIIFGRAYMLLLQHRCQSLIRDIHSQISWLTTRFHFLDSVTLGFNRFSLNTTHFFRNYLHLVQFHVIINESVQLVCTFYSTAHFGIVEHLLIIHFDFMVNIAIFGLVATAVIATINLASVNKDFASFYIQSLNNIGSHVFLHITVNESSYHCLDTVPFHSEDSTIQLLAEVWGDILLSSSIHFLSIDYIYHNLLATHLNNFNQFEISFAFNCQISKQHSCIIFHQELHSTCRYPCIWWGDMWNYHYNPHWS